MKRLTIHLFACICFIIPICLLSHSNISSQERNENHSFEVRSDRQVPLAVNQGGPVYHGELFEYELIMYIQEDEREESLLYQPSQLLMDEDGYFYVADNGNSRIAVFDRNGRFSHAIGRQGNGPGEFRTSRLESVGHDTCTVFDLSLRRSTVFQTDGTLLNTYLLPQTVGPIGISRYVIEHPDRRIITMFSMGGMGGTDPQTSRAKAMIYDANGDTLWFEQTPIVNTSETIDVEVAGNAMSMPSPILFGPMPSAIYHPIHGFLLTPGDKPILDYYHVDGTNRLQVQIEIESGLVSRAERAELRRYFEEQLEAASDFARPIIRKQRESIPSRLTKAPWSNAEIDGFGYTWLQIPTRSMVPSAADSVRSYRVVSPGGEYLGITTRPKGIYYTVSHGFLLANYAPIGTGEYELAVYRIKPVVAGLDYPN